MTAISTSAANPPSADVPAGSEIRARRAGFVADVVSVAGRAVRSIPREPEGVIPAIIIPLFFFTVNIGSLSSIAGQVADRVSRTRRSSSRSRSSSP